MADKTPLESTVEMARAVVAEWEEEKASRVARGYGYLFASREVSFAAALVERMTPVAPTSISNTWGCGGCKNINI